MNIYTKKCDLCGKVISENDNDWDESLYDYWYVSHVKNYEVMGEAPYQKEYCSKECLLKGVKDG